MENSDQSKYGFAKFHKLLLLEKTQVFSIYFYAGLSGLLQLSLPLGIQAIIGLVLGAKMVTSVYILIFFIVIATMLIGVLQLNQMKIIEKVKQKIFVRYAFAFSEKIPTLDSKSTDQYYIPEKINRLFEIVTVQKGLSKFLLDVPIAVIQIIFGLLLIVFYHPLFIVFDLVLILSLFLLLRYTYKTGLKTSLDESDHKYSVVAWLQETGRVIDALKYNNGNDLAFKKTDDKSIGYLQSRTAHFKILFFQFKSIVFFKIFITAILLLLGTYLLFKQDLNIGEFVAVEIVILMVIASLEKIIINLENIYDVITGLIKLDSVLEIESEEDGNIDLDSSVQNFKIEFRNVTFGYDALQPTLKNLDLVIEARQLTVISGYQGSGKSTVFKLISGNYHDFQGLLLINDISILNYNLHSLRSKIGILLHQHDIFEGTLAENIIVGRHNVSESDIMTIAKKVGMEDFITNLPSAWRTKVDPLGKKLPGSLIRKILLLRALVGHPEILLLEEPWLGLNNSIKDKLIIYLKSISNEKTVVLITNDESVKLLGDKQIILDNGTFNGL